MSESPAADERRHRIEKLKHAGSVATALAAIVAAVFSYLETRETSRRQSQVSRESYETLAQMVKELSAQNKKQHDDLTSMKGYVDGVIASVRGKAQDQEAVASNGSGNGSPGPASPASGTSKKPKRPAGAAAPVPLPPPPPSPALAKGPDAVEPPPFQQVQQKALERL